MNDYDDIIKEKYDLKSAKEKFDNIQIPDSLASHIDMQIRRKNRNRLILKITSIAASLIMAFVIGINVSPALADEMSKIPGLAPLVEMVRFDKGLKSAVENGYTQFVGESREDKGIKFTVNNLILDSKKIVIDYSIEADEHVHLDECTLKDENNKQLEAFIGWDNPVENNRGKLRSTIDITMSVGIKIPEKLKFTVTSLRKGYEDKNNVIEGNWDFIIDLDKDLIEDKGIIINCNKKYSLDNYDFEIKNIRIYPAITYVRVKLDSDYKFNGFKSVYLLDDMGIRYNYKGFIGPVDNQTDLMFESGYFNKIKKIYFNASGVYFMTKQDKYLVIDVENKKIIDSGGYGLEYYEEPGNYDENKENIVLKVTDDKILSQKEIKSTNTIDLYFEGYDEKGDKISLSGGHSVSGKDNYLVIHIPKKEVMIKKLKIKIISVSSGNMGDIKIRLK